MTSKRVVEKNLYFAGMVCYTQDRHGIDTVGQTSEPSALAYPLSVARKDMKGSEMTTQSCGIYRITCRANGLHYVGQSKNIQTRWKAHRNLLDKLCHKNTALQDDWFLYGEHLFEWEVVELCDPSDLDVSEMKWADYYDAQRSGYSQQMPDRRQVEKHPDWRQRECITLRFLFRQLRPVGSWINARRHEGYIPCYLMRSGEYCLALGQNMRYFSTGREGRLSDDEYYLIYDQNKPYWFFTRKDTINQSWTCAWQGTGTQIYLSGSYRDLSSDLWAVIQ